MVLAKRSDIPDLVKHVTLALMAEAGFPFPRALETALSRLTVWGYIKGARELKDLAEVRLTPKGVRRNREHAREPSRKSLEFDRLLERFTGRMGLELGDPVEKGQSAEKA